MKISRNGSSPSVLAPEEHYTGTVRFDGFFEGEGESRVVGRTNVFEPGARTAWHSHPLGQTLLITSGLGWVQRRNEPARQVGPGDIVWIPAGEEHWHGATAATAMSHVMILEVQNGIAADWLEKVTDEEFDGLG